MSMRKIAFVAAVPLAVLLLGCGLGSKSDTGSSAGDSGKGGSKVTTVKAGQPITVKDSVLGSDTTATVTLSNVKLAVQPEDDAEAPEKGQYITADVAVTVSKGKYSISSSSFKLVASDGTTYDTTFLSDVQDLSAADLAAGQKSAGTLVFDVPKGVETGAKIALEDDLSDSDAGYWTQ